MVVAGLARRVERIEDLASELSGRAGCLHAYECDITKDEVLTETLGNITREHGPPYVCINNAGFTAGTSLLEGSPAEWRAMADVNVVALCLLTKLAVEEMRSNHIPGHVIHVSSVLANMVIPHIHFVNFYASTKHAVRALTQGLRNELSTVRPKIRVSTVSPGLVETEFIEVSGKTPEEARQFHAAVGAIQPKDVAEAVLYILGAPAHVEIQDIVVECSR